MTSHDRSLRELIEDISRGDMAGAEQRLSRAPELARAKLGHGATRPDPATYFLEGLQHHVYAGDTALHVACVVHFPPLVDALLERGADVRAKNRRGAEPLHYADDGGPLSPTWNPTGQAATITRLIAAGADPNAVDKGGTTPLHRAVRNRCASAVRALLDGGADPKRPNGSGSLALDLARMTTGRGGSGSPEARAEQAEILSILGSRG